MERIQNDQQISDLVRPATLRLWRRAALLVRVASGCLATAWLILGVRDVALTVSASDWPTTVGKIDWVGHARGGRIINVNGISSRPGAYSWVGTPEMQYRYVVGSDTLIGWRANITQPKPEGFRVRPRAWFDGGLPPLAKRSDLSADETSVKVYYDPTDARQSALSVSTSIATWVELVAGVAILLLLLRRPQSPD